MTDMTSDCEAHEQASSCVCAGPRGSEACVVSDAAWAWQGCEPGLFPVLDPMYDAFLASELAGNLMLAGLTAAVMPMLLQLADRASTLLTYNVCVPHLVLV